MMGAVRGILFCGDVVLNAGNEYTVEKDLVGPAGAWSGLIGITALAKAGASTLTLGDDTASAIVDTFAGYSAVVHAGEAPTVTLQSETDATVRLLLEIL